MASSFAATGRWRLICDGDRPGAVNMARDVALLNCVAEGRGTPTLRLYGWQPPCLTLGKHQGEDDAADLAFCAQHGIDVVRRPTGGRALLHHLELTYSVVAPVGVGSLPRALQEAYSRLCGALVRACRSLGIDAALTGGEVNLRLPGPRTSVPCFEAPAGGEVVVGGRKLIGSAMRAHAGVILQHGAILMDWDGELQAGSMCLEDDRELRPQVTTLAEQLGRTPERSEVEDAVVQGFKDELGVSFDETELSTAELAAADELQADFAILTNAPPRM